MSSVSTIKPSTRNQYFVGQKKTLSRSRNLIIVGYSIVYSISCINLISLFLHLLFSYMKDDMSSDQDNSSSQGKPNKEKKKRRGFNISFSFRKNRQKQEDPRSTSPPQSGKKGAKKTTKKKKSKSHGGRSPRPSLWRSKTRLFSSSSSSSSSSSTSSDSDSDSHSSSDVNVLPQLPQSTQRTNLAGNPLSSTSLAYASASGNSVQQFGIPEKEGISTCNLLCTGIRSKEWIPVDMME